MRCPISELEMHARIVVLGAGKGVLFREVSSIPVASVPVIINPRRACAARVTVVVLCVCVCVCPRPSSATRATKRQTRHTGGLSIVLASV